MINMLTKKSTITYKEYLTSRQLTSSLKLNLVRRNLNFCPVFKRLTFCQAMSKIRNHKSEIKNQKAILKPWGVIENFSLPLL